MGGYDYKEVFGNLVSKLQSLNVGFDKIYDIAMEQSEGHFYLAGGLLRDIVNAKNTVPKDIDLFLTETGLAAINDYISNNGRKQLNQFKSIRWYPDDVGDFYYDIIIIKDFNPGLWECEDIVDVLNQFDFTANAIALDLKSKQVFDPINGGRHARRKELRAVRFDYPDFNVSSEIPLRRNSVLYFRYKYYARKLGYVIEPLTQKWIDENSNREADKSLFSTYFFDPDA